MTTMHGGSGLGVDAEGGPVIDPTRNVLDLVEAANNRQDDLRAANNLYLEARLQAQENIAKLHVEYAKEIRAAATAATAALATTTTNSAEVLRSALTQTAQTIAGQTSATVSTINDRLNFVERSLAEGRGKQAVADPMMSELVAEMRELTRQRASESGKTAVTDPALVQLAREVRELVTARASEGGRAAVADPALIALLEEVHRNSATLAANAGQRTGYSNLWGVVVSAAGFIATLLAILGGTYALSTKAGTTTASDTAVAALVQELKAQRETRAAPAASPSVVYIPAAPLVSTTPTTPPPAAPR